MVNTFSVVPKKDPDAILTDCLSYLFSVKKIHPIYVYEITVQFNYIQFKKPLEGEPAKLFLDESREKYLWDYNGWVSDVTLSFTYPFLKAYTILETLRDLFVKSEIRTSNIIVDLSPPKSLIDNQDLVLGQTIRYTISYNDGDFTFQYN